ncbi:MAG: hypothetical protein N3C60_07080 [Calditerrivibrio sp.]|nr:hypothetical protein [Calditerrivibrio sp.]
MYKKLILILLLLFSFFSTGWSEIESYYVGLSAYNDGFYDISAMNLEEFLQKDNRSKEAIFAKYLLYKIYLLKKDYVKAKGYFYQINGIDDNRFDKRGMIFDHVYITAMDNCTQAYDLIEKYRDYSLKNALLGTSCSIDNNTEIDPENLSDRLRFYYIMQIDKVDSIKKAFSLINLSNLSNDEIKQLSIKLYRLELMTEFWKAYNRYRDKDTINLAIERVWKVGKFEDVLKSYQYNKHIDLLPESYCMILDAHFKLNKEVDINLIDRCFVEKNDRYYKSLIKVYSDKNDVKRLKHLINTIPDNYTFILCEIGYPIIKANLLEQKNYQYLRKCGNLDNITDQLLKEGMASSVINLRKGLNDQMSIYYSTYAYGLIRDKKNLKRFYGLLTDEELKNKINKRFGRELK